jgi:hypothetical protein
MQPSQCIVNYFLEGPRVREKKKHPIIWYLVAQHLNNNNQLIASLQPNNIMRRETLLYQLQDGGPIVRVVGGDILMY